jgi:hypothetical protein
MKHGEIACVVGRVISVVETASATVILSNRPSCGTRNRKNQISGRHSAKHSQACPPRYRRPARSRLRKRKITLTPKPVVDRHLAEVLKDLAAGRTHGPYNSAAAAISALKRRGGDRRLRLAAKRRKNAAHGASRG